MEEARKTFEEEMRGQLSEAEVTPPPHVWVAIDGQLANDELSSYKQRTLFYQWVAAACLAILSLSSAYYWGNGETKNEVAVSENPIQPVVTDQTPTMFSESAETDNENIATTSATITPAENTTSNVVENPDQRGILVNQETGEAKEEEADPSFEVLSQQRQLLMQNQMASVHSKDTDHSSELEINELDRIYGVAVVNAKPTLNDSYAQLWAGISVGAGAFDAGFSSGNGANQDVAFNDNILSLVSNSSSSEDQNNPTFPSGNSVAGGLNVGSQLGRRFVLSSGVHYSAFTTGDAQAYAYMDSRTNQPLGSAEAQDYQALGNTDGAEYANVRVDQVSINNEFQYVTVPLKAGVILLDKKFNITLNTGVSSNFLINASLQSDSFDSELDNSASYQTVYFNFLSSVEFGYSIMDRYQLSVEPVYNQAISDFTNSNNLNQGKPKNFGLSVGVRYNF